MSRTGVKYTELREAQRTAGLTHQQTADRLGISRSHWRAVLTGAVKPNPELALRIAAILGLPVDRIPCRVVIVRDPASSAA